nr:MAG TPA: hypothetical protein [Crassvirales sp.]
MSLSEPLIGRDYYLESWLVLTISQSAECS